jgi:hypothetical protein
MRKSHLRLIVAAGLMLCPVPGAAGPGVSLPPAPDDVTVTGKRADRDKLVCKSDVATGSIIPTQTCKTKGEWEEIRQRGLARLGTMRTDQATQRHVSDTFLNLRCDQRAC